MSSGDSAPWIRKIALTFYRREEGQNRLIKITKRLTGFHKIKYFFRSIFSIRLYIIYRPVAQNRTRDCGFSCYHLELLGFT